MLAIRFAMTFLLLAFILAAVMFTASEAAYRKPPFNGSIFGKRNNMDYDTFKAFSALCEVALETCQSFYPQNDNK